VKTIKNRLFYLSLIILFINSVYFSACRMEDKLSIKTEKKFVLEGDGITNFYEPGDMAVDSNGYIYLGRLTTIKESFLVEKYDSEGNQISRFCKPLEPPKKPLALVYNNSKLCIDKNDSIYVAFRYINKLQKFNPAGKLMEEYERELTYIPIKPEHTPDDEKPFILDGVTGDIFCDRNNLLYVISNKIWDENGHLIEILSEDCKVLGQFYSGFLGEELPSYSELQRDQSIYIDKSQNLYVLDTGSMKVQVFKISMY